MGTKVIDKLRIQGKPAPRVDTSQIQRALAYISLAEEDACAFGSPLKHAEPATCGGPGGNRTSRPALVLIPEPGQEVKPKIGRSVVSNTPPSSSSSVASRRLDYLQRVQQANRGLSTADAADVLGATVPSLAVTRQYVNEASSGAGREASASTNHCSSTLPNIQFLLRGKTVQQGEIDFSSYKATSAPHANKRNEGATNSASKYNFYLPHQRVGHYKTSAKEVYRARHKPDIQAFYLDPRHASSAYRAIRTADIDVTYSNTVLGNNVVATNSPAYFYLGPPMSAPDQLKNKNGVLNRPKLYIPTGAAPPSGSVVSIGLGEVHQQGTRVTDFSLTGQQFPTPRYIHTVHNDEGDEHTYNRHLDGLGDYPDGSFRAGSGFMPDIYSRNGGSPPPANGSRRKHTGAPRCGSRESSVVPPVPPSSSAAGADPELLQQCLHVHQSHAVSSPAAELAAAGAPSSESVRLKHFTQYVKKDDTCNTNPYSNTTSSKNVKGTYSHSHRNPKKPVLTPSKAGRYVFDSVSSYIHFNKIYPRLDDNTTNEPEKSNTSNGRPRIPQVDGFTPHCTETVMLKMMFGMNKPAPSVKSGARYSDIAVHADLDEFVVVGSTTNSLSRSTSVASRKFFHNNNNNNNNTSEQSYDTNGKRLSNSTLRRSKSNMSNDIGVAMEEKELEEDEEINIGREAKWRIAEAEDEIKAVEDNGNTSRPDGEVDNDVLSHDYNERDADSNGKSRVIREESVALLENHAQGAEND